VSKKQIIVLVIIGIVALFFVVRIIKNALTSEEAKIKKLIKELAVDFEDKKFKNIFKHVTEDYADDGRNTKDSLKADAKLILAMATDIDVSIRDLRVVVSEDERTAEAGFSARVRMTTKFGDIEPLRGDNEQIALFLRKEDGRWMTYRSTLRRYRADF
jgi:hypothetical protein